jgi:hypothetical protein
LGFSCFLFEDHISHARAYTPNNLDDTQLPTKSRAILWTGLTNIQKADPKIQEVPPPNIRWKYASKKLPNLARLNA